MFSSAFTANFLRVLLHPISRGTKFTITFTGVCLLTNEYFLSLLESATGQKARLIEFENFEVKFQVSFRFRFKEFASR